MKKIPLFEIEDDSSDTWMGWNRSPSSREEARREIAEQTEEFLANGGEIEHIDAGESNFIYSPWNFVNNKPSDK